MDLQFIFYEQHKEFIEYINNFCNKVNFSQDIFTFDLITDLFVCFIMQNLMLFCMDINEEVQFKTTKLFHNSHQGWDQNEPSQFNMFQKFMSLKAMLSWHFFIVFNSENSHLEPFILTHSKFREATCRSFWKAL